jgi:hypothetical protein
MFRFSDVRRASAVLMRHGSATVPRTVMTGPMRLNVDLVVHKRNSDVTMDIVSIKNGAVMVLQIAEIIPMRWVRRVKNVHWVYVKYKKIPIHLNFLVFWYYLCLTQKYVSSLDLKSV